MRKFGVGIGVTAATVAACGIPPLPAEAPAPAGTTYHLTAVSGPPPQAVDASSQLASNPATAATDGNTGTAWSDGGYRNPTSWLRLRYAAEVALASVAVRMPPAAAGTAYDLQVSGDGTTWTTALANQKNATWNSETKVLPAGTRVHAGLPEREAAGHRDHVPVRRRGRDAGPRPPLLLGRAVGLGAARPGRQPVSGGLHDPIG